MRTLKTTMFASAAALVMASSTLAAAPMGVAPAEWSARVWSAAVDGDWSTIDGLLDRLPESEDTGVEELRSHVDRYRANRVTEANDVASARSEALVEMTDHLAEDHVARAIQAAVKAQTLSENFDEAMLEPQVQAVLQRASDSIDDYIEDGNTLMAQTLLYYLRTFYEDTSRRDIYDELDERLAVVTRKIALVRLYAPRRFHELWIDRATRLGDDVPDEFFAPAVDHWRERVEDIEPAMVIRSLNLAATEHMDGVGWKALLESGLLSAMQLGSTPAIAETFPAAGEDALLAGWTTGVTSMVDTLEEPLRHLPGRRVLIHVLDELLTLNETTLKLPEGVILREFGDGAMSALDRYSAIIWPDEQRRFQQQTEGHFIGVGIVIRENQKGEIMVVSPIEGSPAYYGGVLPEDVIVRVGGRPTAGWSLNDAVDRITGPRGTPVTLTLRRDATDSTLDVQLTRDRVKLQSVKGWWKDALDDEGLPTWDWFIDRGAGIAYVRLTGFSEETYGDLRRAVEQMRDERSVNGMILDLRHNPGGLLPSARAVSNLFVRTGTIVKGEDPSGEQLFEMRAHPNRAHLADLPVVVLINQGSASASEIVAGCIQAHDAGVIVGQRSWGKGSVQTVHPVSPEASLKLTTQYYRLPSSDGGETPGRLVHKRRGSSDWGVMPDVRVPMSPSQVIDSNMLRQEADMISLDPDSASDRPDIRRLISEGLDPQLETALLLLQANALRRTDADHRQVRLR